jgi:hypothetical protein
MPADLYTALMRLPRHGLPGCAAMLFVLRTHKCTTTVVKAPACRQQPGVYLLLEVVQGGGVH